MSWNVHGYVRSWSYLLLELESDLALREAWWCMTQVQNLWVFGGGRLYNQRDPQQVCNNAVNKSAVNIGTFLNSLLLNKRHMFHPKVTDHTPVNILHSHFSSTQLSAIARSQFFQSSTVRELVGSSWIVPLPLGTAYFNVCCCPRINSSLAKGFGPWDHSNS